MVIKKSISGPGAGNYFSVGKTFKDLEQVFGEKIFKDSCAFIAHGTKIILNQITESHIMSNFAKEFDVANMPVTSVKSKLGHTIGTAGMDQLWAGLGALETQTFGNLYNSKLADDVFKDNLDYYLQDKEFDNRKDVVFFSKGFGGNNATTALISSDLTRTLLEKNIQNQNWVTGRAMACGYSECS